MDPQSLCIIEPLSCWAVGFQFPEPTIRPGCEFPMLWMCLVVPSDQTGKIFGFSEYVQAFALLMVVYTISDIRYRFRIATAPFALYRWTFVSCGVIGFGTLLTDLIFSHHIPLPRYLTDQLIWQAAFGAIFLGVVSVWLWYAFIRPPVFGKSNALRYGRTVYTYILRGSDSELPIVAGELIGSAFSIVALAERDEKEPKDKITAGRVANDVLLLIGSRKFCRHVVASSPGTAIAFFEEMSKQKKFHLPINQFASNVSTEAIRNKDSLLYHEDGEYYSGFLGYTKPFSKALYGNWRLVEALAHHRSPLDLNYETRSSWEAAQLEAYCRAVLMTFESYLEENPRARRHSYALYRAFHVIVNSADDISRLDGLSDYYRTNEYGRLEVVLKFVQDAIALLEKKKPQPATLRHRGVRRAFQEDFYDHIASMMFEVILHAGYIKGPPDTCWAIQHNAIWFAIFSIHEGEALRIIRFKLRRLLYDEILHLQDFPNFKSSRILGYCLAVMGIAVGDKTGFGKEEYALRKAVLNWTKKNFMSLHRAQPFVAETCLLGAISFEEKKAQLVKTYPRNLDLTVHRDTLKLDSVRSGNAKPRKPRRKKNTAVLS